MLNFDGDVDANANANIKCEHTFTVDVNTLNNTDTIMQTKIKKILEISFKQHMLSVRNNTSDMEQDIKDLLSADITLQNTIQTSWRPV